MPEMRKESAAAAVNVDLGNVNVQIDPVTAGVQKTFRGDRNGNLVLPAGAYSVYLRHADVSGGVITVNGEPIQYNGTFSKEAQLNRVTNQQDFVPEITIVNPDGKIFWLDAAYPSSSSFNPDAI
ncbi:MAG: hypothetical protein AAF840_08945 [Bacteroidota bacterium]